MSSESIISEVQKHPSPWNLNHVHYHNRLMNDRLWASVADSLKLPKDVVKTKWRNLRDTFNKENEKIPKPRSGSSADDAPVYTGKWAYFNAMIFLKDVFTPRETESNIPTTDAGDVEEADPDNPADGASEGQLTSESEPSSSILTNNLPTSVDTQKKKKKDNDKVCVAPDSVRPKKKVKPKIEHLCLNLKRNC